MLYHEVPPQMMMHSTQQDKRSNTLMILAIPSFINFDKFYEDQLEMHAACLESIKVLQHVVKFPNSFYSVIITFRSQTLADSLYHVSIHRCARYWNRLSTEDSLAKTCPPARSCKLYT